MEGFHRILPLGLIALLFGQLLMLAWPFLPMSSGQKIVPLPITVNEAVIHSEINMDDVISLDLFGQVTETNKQPEIKREVVILAPETSLNLKLKGVYKSDGTTPSSVIIEGSNKKQTVYYEGEELLEESSRILVHEIHSRHVILKRGERYEKLVLFGELQKEGMVSSVVSEEGLPNELLLEADAIPTIDQTKNIEITKKITEIINLLQNEPLSLKGAMSIQPVKVDDVFQGYKVSPGDDKALFKALGFVKDDVVTAINGIELDGASKIMSVLGSLSSATEIEIKTLRDDQPLAFRYSVE